MPPNDETSQKRIQQQVVKAVSRSEICTYHIIGGDFNTLEDSKLDTANHKKEGTRKKLPLFNWLRSLGFTETFRKCNPETKKYSWSNRNFATRIDYIWISEGLTEWLEDSDIEEMEGITQSDHNLVWARISLKGIIGTQRASTGDSRKATQKVYIYNKATKENWEDYRAQLDNILKVNYGKIQRRGEENEENENRADELWDLIERAIGKAAARNIPRTRIRKNEKKTQSRPYQKELKMLARLQKIAKDKEDQEVDEVDHLLYNEQILNINRSAEIEIPEWPNRVSSAWHEEIKGWWRTIKAKASLELLQNKEKQIRENIDRRYSMIVSDQRRMLNSILERPRRGCTIDRVLIENQEECENPTLVTSPQEVREETRNFFKKQFGKRKHGFDNLGDWEEEYKPKDWIKESWYELVTEKVSEEEWSTVIQTASTKTAPGMSGIGYTLLQKAGIEATHVFIILANLVIQEGLFPAKWKKGLIYPIPKSENWDYRLAKTRPIILLETFRKNVVRIVQKRLSRVLMEHNILKGLNYAGLPGLSTTAPIHIMNNVLEEAIQKKKELWVAFQDMRKAFDSVSLIALTRAMERVKFPKDVITFVLNLYERREIFVITNFGNTSSFKAEDGIDQGEVISPLMWRIFYDPLLSRIQEKELGFSMEVEWPLDIQLGTVQKRRAQVGVLAYADDTTWIAPNKKSLQETINISNSFFELNDIEINSQKSELLVLNSKEKIENQAIRMGTPPEKVQGHKELAQVRFLGVWLSKTRQRQNNIKRGKKEVLSIVHMLRYKKISVSQAVYINNKILLPRLEYKLMNTMLNKKTCEEIQQPFLKLIKWKAGVASTSPNIVVVHPNLIGAMPLWNRHMEHHWTEWVIRMNDPGALGETTRLRLMQGQLDMGCPASILETQCMQMKHSILIKNLTLSVLSKAKEYGIEIISNEYTKDWNLRVEAVDEIQIREILATRKFTGSIESMTRAGVWYTSQLLDKEGKHMITWRQLKNLRSLSSKGNKALWFREIEAELLEDKQTRKVKPGFRSERGSNKLRLDLKGVSRDQRRKEWVLIENKENSQEIEIGKIQKKMAKKVRLEAWSLKDERGGPRETVERLEKEVKKEKVERYAALRDISNFVQKKEGTWGITVDREFLREERVKRREKGKEKEKEEEVAIEVRVESWEHILIKQVVGEGKLGNEIIEMLEYSRNWDGKAIYFTDGSLKDKASMGFGGLLTDEEMQVSIREFSGSIRNWASSTRPELAAILCALLATPRGREVEIYTDSSAAIIEVEKLSKKAKLREWSKKKNSALLIAIQKAIVTKDLNVSLHKVKAHSGIVLNERADELAKRSIRDENELSLQQLVSKDNLYKLCFKGIEIEYPVRTFVKKVLQVQLAARWVFATSKKDIEHAERKENTDWSVFWSLLRMHQKPVIYTTRTDRAWMFRIKCINRLLPTLESRKLHTRSVYTEITCRKCRNEAETMEHLTECVQDTEKWGSIERKVIEDTMKAGSEHVQEKISSSQLRNILKWETEDISQGNDRRRKLIRGVVSQEIRADLRRKGLSERESIEIVSMIWNKWIDAFYEEIWKPRCQEVATWEKAEGLKLRRRKIQKQKKEKAKHRKRVGEYSNLRAAHREEKEKEEGRIRKIGIEEVLQWIRGSKVINWCKI
jgi:ribonuclease HI